MSLHEHNESERIDELLEKLRAGARIALVSDAGTPLLSDPGFELVRRVAQEGITIVAVPGPSAITAALSIAGLPTERFSFEGFLPARLAERRARLAELAARDAHAGVLRGAAPHRRMPRGHERGLRRRAARGGGARAHQGVRDRVSRHAGAARRRRRAAMPNFTRGEITLVVAGAPPAAAADVRAQLDATLTVLLGELAPSKAAALAARLTGAKRNDAYARALELSGRVRGASSDAY